MSFLKSIQHGKEKRKPHVGSKTFDPWCLNHGGCSRCLGNRRYRDNKIAIAINEELAAQQYVISPIDWRETNSQSSVLTPSKNI